MIDIKELKKLSVDEMADALQKDLDSFKTEVVEKLMTLDACNEEEKNLMAEMDANDDYIRNCKYDLPKLAEYDGVTYTPAQVFKFISGLISKQELEFRFCTGMYMLYKFFSSKTVPTNIEYGVLDSVLHTLNCLRFKGPEEWKQIMVIHNFFYPLTSEYKKDQSIQLYYANKHDVILRRQALCGPTGEIDTDAIAKAKTEIINGGTENIELG